MKFVISETCAPEARDVFMDEHSNGHLAKGHDKLAVIKEETNIEDLIKDEKAEDVELNMIVDEVVLVGNGLAGALQFCMKCSVRAQIGGQASDANASGLSVVEKEHPRSLTPMLWAKKVAMIFPVPLRNYFTFGNVCLVQIYSNLPYSETCYSAFLCQVEHFSEHQTKRPCWEQCLRHLQRDRRTEPAVDLTVWSRFRALTDSNDRARYQRHMTCGENFSDQRYLPMHMLSHEIAEPEPMVLSVTLLCV
uniref:C2H2-type domain-containing protein n=1 Tax=Oryza glumipatula TaxID=40148 RepID=A0A0D9ZQT3_9ORYZ